MSRPQEKKELRKKSRKYFEEKILLTVFIKISGSIETVAEVDVVKSSKSHMARPLLEVSVAVEGDTIVCQTAMTCFRFTWEDG